MGMGAKSVVTFEAARGPLERATLDLADEPRAAIATWLRLLCEWNARVDPTAARTPEELVDLMVADALVLAPRLPKDARVVDVGSGAGAPGLPLALVRPDLKMTLCEPLAKRAAFLRTVLGTVNRVDVALANKRGDELAAGAFDVAVSRATLAPEAWLALGASLVKDGGEVGAAREGRGAARGGVTLEDEAAYEWPETKAQRRIARYVVRSR